MSGASTPGTTSPLGQGVTGLTLDMLAERIDHEQEMREIREEAAREALHTATSALDKRLEGLNEFRQTLSDQNRTFVSQSVFDTKNEGLANRITLLERTAERTAGAVATWRFLAGGGGLLGLISIGLWFLNPSGPTL